NELRRWQHRLRREEENLRTALRWALERGEAEIGLRTASAVWDFWHYWAEVREGIALLESLIALPAAAAPTDARARGLEALGGLVYWQGKPDRAWDLYEEALAIRRELGDAHALADALFETAWAAAAAYDLDRATERAKRSARPVRRVGRYDQRPTHDRLDPDRASDPRRGRGSEGGDRGDRRRV
ncbi:MAG: hypothetical protein ACRDGB_05840, partial [Candidatus Limnocylindria bacterium]